MKTNRGMSAFAGVAIAIFAVAVMGGVFLYALKTPGTGALAVGGGTTGGVTGTPITTECNQVEYGPRVHNTLNTSSEEYLKQTCYVSQKYDGTYQEVGASMSLGGTSAYGSINISCLRPTKTTCVNVGQYGGESFEVENTPDRSLYNFQVEGAKAAGLDFRAFNNVKTAYYIVGSGMWNTSTAYVHENGTLNSLAVFSGAANNTISVTDGTPFETYVWVKANVTEGRFGGDPAGKGLAVLAFDSNVLDDTKLEFKANGIDLVKVTPGDNDASEIASKYSNDTETYIFEMNKPITYSKQELYINIPKKTGATSGTVPVILDFFQVSRYRGVSGDIRMGAIKNDASKTLVMDAGTQLTFYAAIA